MNRHGNRTRPMGEIERQAYAYAQRWATGLSRRDLLKAFGVAGAAAIADPLGLSAIAAAPGGGIIPRATRFQEGTGLRIARGQLTDSLDPQKTAALVSHEVMWQIYDSLIYLDEQGTVHPGLATEWTFSDDNLTVTYKLREGVTFHDSTPLTAEIVQGTVDRHRDPATASPTAYMLGPLDAVTVIDDLTVAYSYTEPFVPMFVGLGYSYCAPISLPAVQEFGDQFGRNPVGTGPYRFVEWTADDTIVLEKNAEHEWATTFYKTQQAPAIDRVEFVVIPEDATRLSALEAGEIDVIAGTDAVPIDKIRLLQETPGVKVFTRPAVGVYYNYINTKVKPLDDARVRQALNYAVDKDALVQLVLDGNGVPAVSPLASAFGDFNPNLNPYTYDPEKAQALLVEAGLEDGFDLTYIVIASPIYQRAAEVIQENLAAINVNVTMEAYPVADVFARGPAGDYGMLFFYYTYSDPDVLYLVCNTDGGSLAWSFQDDPELNSWLEQQRVTFDKDQRRDFLWKAQERINDQAYWLFLWEGVYAAAMREDVQGLDIDLVGFIHLQEMSRTS